MTIRLVRVRALPRCANAQRAQSCSFESRPLARRSVNLLMRLLRSSLALISLAAGSSAASAASASSPKPAGFDYSSIRGANYCAAAGHHVEHWLNYDPKETARDLDYARQVHLNQVRVFLSYSAYLKNKDAFRRNLRDLVRACEARGIGLMPVVSYKAEMPHESAPKRRVLTSTRRS